MAGGELGVKLGKFRIADGFKSSVAVTSRALP